MWHISKGWRPWAFGCVLAFGLASIQVVFDWFWQYRCYIARPAADFWQTMPATQLVYKRSNSPTQHIFQASTNTDWSPLAHIDGCSAPWERAEFATSLAPCLKDKAGSESESIDHSFPTRNNLSACSFMEQKNKTWTVCTGKYRTCFIGVGLKLMFVGWINSTIISNACISLLYIHCHIIIESGL